RRPSPVSIRNNRDVQALRLRNFRPKGGELPYRKLLHANHLFFSAAKEIPSSQSTLHHKASSQKNLQFSLRALRESMPPYGSNTAPAPSCRLPPAGIPSWASARRRISCTRCSPLLPACARERSDCRRSFSVALSIR